MLVEASTYLSARNEAASSMACEMQIENRKIAGYLHVRRPIVCIIINSPHRFN